MENCPFLKSESCCPLEKMSNPIVTGVAFGVFNLCVILINCYEIGIITLVSYGALFAILGTIAHVKLMQFLNKEVKTECEKSECCDEKVEEEKFKQTFLWVYSKSNDAIQFLRKVILVQDVMLTAKFVLILYVASQFAFALGDFCFFVFLGNDIILLPLLYVRFGGDAIRLWKDGVSQVREKSKFYLDKVPKYSDLKNN